MHESCINVFSYVFVKLNILVCWIGLDWVGLGWVLLGCVVLCCVVLGWNKCDRIKTIGLPPHTKNTWYNITQKEYYTLNKIKKQIISFSLSFFLFYSSFHYFYLFLFRSHPIIIVKPVVTSPASVLITIGNKDSRTGLRKCNPTFYFLFLFLIVLCLSVVVWYLILYASFHKMIFILFYQSLCFHFLLFIFLFIYLFIHLFIDLFIYLLLNKMKSHIKTFLLTSSLDSWHTTCTCWDLGPKSGIISRYYQWFEFIGGKSICCHRGK